MDELEKLRADLAVQVAAIADLQSKVAADYEFIKSALNRIETTLQLVATANGVG